MSALGQFGGRLYRGEVSFDFVGRKRLWYAISGLILLISIVAVLVRGLSFSVDFKGGAVFTFPSSSTSVSQVQSAVESGGVSGAIVQQTHGQKDGWQIQTKSLTGAQTVALEKTLSSKLGVNSDDITVTTVGPSWGSQISGKALEALIAFLIVIVIYLSIAFELRMAIAAFIALIHDLVIATGIYALAGFQVSPATVIGLLTILGYSLYDTVVVFDKVRENTAGLLGGARTTYSQAANLALNQTLVRSINTSLIALLPVTGHPDRGDRPARRQQRARGTRARPVRRHAVRHLLLDLHRDPGAGRPEGAPAAVPGAGQAGGGARLRWPGGKRAAAKAEVAGRSPVRRHGRRTVGRAARRGRTGRRRLRRRDRRVGSDRGRADHHRVARPGRAGQPRRAGDRPARPAAAAAPQRRQHVPAPPGRQEEAALADDHIRPGPVMS